VAMATRIGHTSPLASGTLVSDNGSNRMDSLALSALQVFKSSSDAQPPGFANVIEPNYE